MANDERLCSDSAQVGNHSKKASIGSTSENTAVLFGVTHGKSGGVLA